MSNQNGSAAPDQWPRLPGSITIDQILDIISKETKIDRSALVPGATMDSLNIASLDMVEMLFEIEEQFNVYIPMGDDLTGEVYLANFIKTLANQMQEDAVQPGTLAA